LNVPQLYFQTKLPPKNTYFYYIFTDSERLTNSCGGGVKVKAILVPCGAASGFDIGDTLFVFP